VRRLVTIASLLISAFGVGSWPSGVVEAQPSAPRLLVILIVDQMRADYIDYFAHRWRSGIRVLLDQGARFTAAKYPYLNTATCTGHVSIATGALPRTHGVILNRWWDRDERRAVNCMEDASSPHLSYGAAAASGNSAKRLLAPTLADELRAQRPGGRVVSLSLKPRSAIGLAGHGGTAVTWFDDGARSFVTSRAFTPEPIASVRTFVARESPAADLGKVWAQQDRDETYREPDLGSGERPKAGWTALFPHPLLGVNGADAQFYDRWQKSPFSDAYLGRMAAALIDDLQLGQRGTTDYLAISFSALDLLAHDFGSNSREVEDLLAQLDATIGAVIQRLDDRVGRDNYIVALTSDHGASPTPDGDGGHIANEDLQQIIEQTLIRHWGAARTPYAAWVGSGAVYFADGVWDRLRRDAPAMKAITDALIKVPGMMRVLRADAISDRSRDPIVRAAAAGYVPGRSPDLFLLPKRRWVIELRAENEATQHGTFHDYDRHVPVLLRGYGIKPGRSAAAVTPLDIAPTLAHLAGLTLPKADGRVLREAVRERATIERLP
jgi:hypothetical protein